MELHIWDGDTKWGVPSMDLKSLQLLTYVKISGAPVTIIKSTNPFKSPTGKLPVFKCSEGAFSDFSQVTTILRKQNYSCDYELSAKQCSEVLAYEHLLIEKLYPALLYLWWVEPKTYYDVIYKWYFKSIPFPHKFVYPWRFHKGHTEMISSLYDEFDNIDIVETELHCEAKDCLTMLSNRLGDKDYFFGRNPSTIDALLFSYLILILKVDIKVTVLQNHVKTCPNLVRYINKMMNSYFPSEKNERNSDSHDSPSFDDFPNKGRNIIISGLVAFMSMFGYAFVANLVQINEVAAEEEDDDDKEYEYEYVSFDND